MVCSNHHKNKRPELEMATIFHIYWDSYVKRHKVSNVQKKTAWSIMNCRTHTLGTHTEKCSNPDCDYEFQACNSCRDRNCPKCDGSKRLKWVSERLKELLPIPYYHVVFTMPHMLCLLARFNAALIYDLFFKATSYTLKAFSKDPRFLDAELGIIGILHTWGKMLSHHPHIHYIVTGGGLSWDKSYWKNLPYSEKFIFPSTAMSRTLRKRFVYLLKSAYSKGKLLFPGQLSDISLPSQFDQFCYKLGSQSWYNYAKTPFSGPEKVLEYLSRYTHRVAISNSHLVDIENDQIYFTYRDYKDDRKIKLTSLPALTFIYRFLLHVVPSGFRKIRYYGFLSTCCRKDKLEIIRELLDHLFQDIIVSVRDWLDRIGDYINRKCPKCEVGTLVYLFDTS